MIHCDGRKRIQRLEAAAAAASDVIPLKQRALCRRKYGCDLLHGPPAGQVFRIRAHRRFRLHQRFQRADVEFIVAGRGRARCLLAENPRK